MDTQEDTKELRKEIIKKHCKNALEVCKLFSDYFGEAYVDNNFDFLCDAFNEAYPDIADITYINTFLGANPIDIIVKFPKVRVTNENGNFVDITNLFVKTSVYNNGKIYHKFLMIRTEYTPTQWKNNYCHSHVSFNRDNPASFLDPCLGGGPIQHTIAYLRNNFDIQRWGLFCFELSKYVTVESLTGGPYRRLENLGRGAKMNFKYNYTTHVSVSWMPSNLLKVFIKKFIKSYNWKFKFNGKTFELGEPLINFWINVSNACIKWYNDCKTSKYFRDTYSIRSTGLFSDYFISNSMVYSEQEEAMIENMANSEGRELFMFKGEMQKLHITGKAEEGVKTKLLQPHIRNYIIVKVLKIINSTYGREIKIDPETAVF